MRRIAAVLLLIGLVAGCTGGNDDVSTASADSGTAGKPVQAAPAVAPAAPLPRSIVRTAELDVRVDDVRRAADRAEDLVVAAGGEVATEQLDIRVDEPVAELLLLVPPARLSQTLDALAALGQQQQRRLGREDVTDQVVDLDSRLRTQRSSVARVRDLLARASNLGDVVRLEAELSKRQADLESLQARLRALSGTVAQSRVTLRLTTRTDTAVAGDIGFASGLDGGWSAFLATARVLAATAGALLPFLPLLAFAGWVAWRRRARTA